VNAFSTGLGAFGSGFGDVINASQSGAGAVITSFVRGNPELKPERNRETEVGFDLGLFDQRADVGFTYYSKRSTDVILSVPVSASLTGYLNQLANAAEITNKGVEVTFNMRPIQRQNFGLELGLQYGRNKGRVERLAGDVEFVPYNNEGFTGAIGSSTVGFAPGVVRGQDFARCGRGLRFDYDGDNTIDDIDALCAQGGNNVPGALFITGDGVPVPDPTDRVIADGNPDWTGGLSASLTLFRRLRLSGFVDTRQGFEVWNGTRGILYNFGTHKDTEARSGQGVYGKGGTWYTDEEVAGPGAGQPFATNLAGWQGWLNGEGGGFGSVGRQFVEDGSFVKLRELSAALTLDQPWLRNRLGVSTADIRVAGRNLFMWTDYKGLDPEANLGGAEWLTQGIDYFSHPQSRSLVISITLNR
jgi:hypothetical protein